MNPDEGGAPRSAEKEALRRHLARGAWRTGSTVIAILLVCAFLVVRGVTDDAARQHFLGQSHHTEAEVVDEATDGRCRRGTRHVYTLDWAEDGGQRVETIRRCRDSYDVGETIDIWSTNAMPYTESPARWWLISGGLLAGLLTMVVFAARQADRAHRVIAAVLSGQPMAGPFPATRHAYTGVTHARLDPLAPQAMVEVPKGRAIVAVQGTPRRSVRTPTGQLWVTELRDGKPRGLALYAGDDGSRQWRWVG